MAYEEMLIYYFKLIGGPQKCKFWENVNLCMQCIYFNLTVLKTRRSVNLKY